MNMSKISRGMTLSKISRGTTLSKISAASTSKQLQRVLTSRLRNFATSNGSLSPDAHHLQLHSLLCKQRPNMSTTSITVGGFWILKQSHLHNKLKAVTLARGVRLFVLQRGFMWRVLRSFFWAVPKEIKKLEARVGLTPSSAKVTCVPLHPPSALLVLWEQTVQKWCYLMQ